MLILQILLYIIQLSISLFYIELATNIDEYHIFQKLFAVLLCISYLIFSLERRVGSIISEFSSLDLLLFIICVGGVFLATINFINYPWFFFTLFALWFNLSFVLNRTIFNR